MANQHELNCFILEEMVNITREIQRLYDGEITSYDITAIRERLEQILQYNRPVI